MPSATAVGRWAESATVSLSSTLSARLISARSWASSGPENVVTAAGIVSSTVAVRAPGVQDADLPAAVVPAPLREGDGAGDACAGARGRRDRQCPADRVHAVAHVPQAAVRMGL